MIKVSHIAMIALLAIGVTAIVAPTAASAAATNCTFSCQPPPGGGDPGGGNPGGGGPGPGDPGGNEPGDEGDPDGGDDPGDGGDPGEGDDPGDGGDPGEGGDPGGGGGPGGGGPGGGDDDGAEPKLVVALDCAIKDEQAMTTDLWLVNVGTANLEAGMKIRYSIPATGESGAFYLPKTIEAGKEGRLSDFISEIPVGEECRVEIIA